MGYRSSVYFSIPSSSYEDFCKDLNLNAVEDKVDLSEVTEFLSDMRQEQFQDQYVYFNSYIKWYTDDPVIGLVERVVKGIEEATFIRYGEDSDDVDFWSNDSAHWIRWGGVSCVASDDALNAACCYLDGIEQALPAVRRLAIEKLNNILNKLRDAEGLVELETDDAFQEVD